MVSEGYELFALGMRYVFVLLGVLILWRAFRWMRRDARNYRREMRRLPDAGLVGEIVSLATGQSQPLPWEGTMGSSRDCDIRVKGAGVRHHHALFVFEPGKGMLITPRRGAQVLMAGVELRGGAHALHGTQLQLGEVPLRVRLFAGLKVPRPAAFQAEYMNDPAQQEDDAPWEELAGAVPAPFAPTAGYAQPAFEEAPEEMPYAGNYTDDGQMTWQYAAYPLEELRRAQEEAEGQPAEEAGEDVGIPYESPLPRRRRRDRR